MVYGETIALEADYTVYPNPFADQLAVQFTLAAESEIVARIYDMTGKMVADLMQRTAKKGLNELSFSLSPLTVGNYVLKIEADGKEIVSEKIVKKE